MENLPDWTKVKKAKQFKRSAKVHFPNISDEDIDTLLALRSRNFFLRCWNDCQEKYPPNKQLSLDEAMGRDKAKERAEGGCLMNGASLQSYTTRQVAVSVHVDLLKRENIDASPALGVVTGESGSGKTYSMVHLKKPHELGVYMTSGQLVQEFKWQETTEDTNRDQRAFETIKQAITTILAGTASFELCQLQSDIQFFVIFDELGEVPQFLRALCALHAGLPSKLNQLLHLKPPREWKFVCGGTGATARALSFGSDPNTFHAVFMPSGSQVWDEISSQIQPSSRFIDAVKQSPTAKRFGHNPRVAALMAVALKDGPGFVDFTKLLGPHYTKRAAQNLLPFFFNAVAAKFRGLNGLRSKTSWLSMAGTFEDACRAVYFPDKIGNDQLRLLTTNYGVVVDNAKWEQTCPPGWQLVGEAQLAGGYNLYSPPQRYTISPAQNALFRLGYGFSTYPPTGEGFEQAMAQYLEGVLLGAKGSTLQALLAKLGFQQMKQTKKTALSAELLQQVLAYNDVCVVSSNIKIQASLASDERKEVKRWFKMMNALLFTHNSAVVVINRDKAEYADLIVLLPNLLVLLEQLKFYAPGVQQTQHDQRTEAFKMGVMSLKALAAKVADVVEPADTPTHFLRRIKDTAKLKFHFEKHGDQACDKCGPLGKAWDAYRAQGRSFDDFISTVSVSGLNDFTKPTVRRTALRRHLEDAKHDVNTCVTCNDNVRFLLQKCAQICLKDSAKVNKQLRELAKAKSSLVGLMTTTQEQKIDELGLYFHATPQSVYPVELPEHDKKDLIFKSIRGVYNDVDVDEATLVGPPESGKRKAKSQPKDLMQEPAEYSEDSESSASFSDSENSDQKEEDK